MKKKIRRNSCCHLRSFPTQNLRNQVTIWPQKGEQASGILELLASYHHRPTTENAKTHYRGLELELGGKWTLCPPLLRFCPPRALLTLQQPYLLKGNSSKPRRAVENDSDFFRFIGMVNDEVCITRRGFCHSSDRETLYAHRPPCPPILS